MGNNTLYPAFVRVNYTTPYGVHSMSIPSVGAVPDAGALSGWLFDLRGAAISIDVDVSVNDFIDLLPSWFKTGVKFTDYTLFTVNAPGDPGLPRLSRPLTQVGTNTASGWDKATQLTFTWRTEDFGLFKLVLLDYNSGGDFSKTVDPTLYPNLNALNNYVTSTNSWLSGRDGARPTTFLQGSSTLNEKLRRSYKLT